MRTTSISVGIGQYLHEEYAKSDMRLHFAQDDARAFSLYAKGADDLDDNDARHRLLVDGEADWDRVRAAATQIAAAGRPDLFMLYLSGHGEAGATATGGWFCLVDAEPGVPSLTGPRIDELLRIVDAPNTLLVVDCCFAEALIGGCGFFRYLQDSSARFAIASARADQRSWEDASLKRSVFSDVLIRSLSVGSAVADPSGHVDVERALFPALREQVPLLASSRKDGAVQEPVTAGMATQEIRLPTVFGRSLGRPLSVSEAIRSGVKRFLVAAAVVLVAILAGLDALVYHLAVSPTGSIVVRPGLKQTFDLQPIHVGPIDTGIRLAQIDRLNDEGARKLAEAKILGFRTHLDDDGLRTWLSPLEPMLNYLEQQSVSAFARGAKPKFDPDSAGPPLLETMFVAALEKVDVAAVGMQVYARELKIDIACDDTGIVNLSYLSPNSDAFAAEASWAALTASHDPGKRSARLADLMRLAAYRAANTKEFDVLRKEFDTFAKEALRIVGAADKRPEFVVALKPHLVTKDDGWCAVHRLFLSAVTGSAEESRSAETELWRILFMYDPSKQPRRPILAGEALQFLGRIRELDRDSVVRLAKWIDSSNEGLDVDQPPQNLLRGIGEIRGYPDEVQALLEAKLGKQSAEFDFSELLAAHLLACSAGPADPPRRDRLGKWLDANTESQRTMSDYAAALGCASAYRPLNSAQLGVLFARLSPKSRFQPESVNYWGETVIDANNDASAVALGRYVQHYDLPVDRVEQLANVAQSRPDLKDRPEVLRGLAVRWYGAGSTSAEGVYRRLQGCTGDGQRRSLEIEVAADVVARSQDRARIIADLLQIWKTESAPEMRVAVAKVVAMGILN
ncbi:hypothetical protein [Bradyrhizobium sp. 25ACV]